MGTQHEQLEQKKAVLETCVAGAVSFLEGDGNVADGLLAAWMDFKKVFDESADGSLCDSCHIEVSKSILQLE